MPMPSPPVHQLQPFNECRFDDCMAHLSATHGRPLSVYEAVKLHVMIDVFHALAHGKPVIGGRFYPFTNGPVSRSAKSRLYHWEKQYQLRGTMPDGFALLEDGVGFRFEPTRVPDVDDFSESELAAMDAAWAAVVPVLDRGFAESQDFFHRSSSIGRAWRAAQKRGTDLDWADIFHEYVRQPDGPAQPIRADLLTL